nr:MAG TPA: hypothetical protein [Caudoviricetes sp.]
MQRRFRVKQNAPLLAQAERRGSAVQRIIVGKAIRKFRQI